MKKLRNELDKQILTAIEHLSSLNPDSEEYAMTTESLERLYKLRIDQTNAETEAACKDKQRLTEQKDRYLRLGVDAAGIVLPLLFYGIWMRRGLEFEKEGCFTSATFKGLIGKFRPAK